MSLLDEVECYGFTCYVVDCEVDAPERWSRAEAMQDEREHRAWHEQHPGLVFVDGHAPQPADLVQGDAKLRGNSGDADANQDHTNRTQEES